MSERCIPRIHIGDMVRMVLIRGSSNRRRRVRAGRCGFGIYYCSHSLPTTVQAPNLPPLSDSHTIRTVKTCMASTTSPLQPTAWMSSWWDRYFAPGDVRAQRRLEAEHQRKHQEEQLATAASQSQRIRIDPATRARRQNGLLFGGVAFTLLSMFITRRSLSRKLHSAYPRTFTPSNATPPRVDGGLEAAEALGLATLNVFSLAMVSVGGMMKVFDVADVEDLRVLLRKSVGEDVMVGESQADREIEGWIADVLSRKDAEGKFLREGVADRLVEIEKARKEKERVEGKR